MDERETMARNRAIVVLLLMLTAVAAPAQLPGSTRGAVLIVRGAGSSFDEAELGIREELGGALDVYRLTVDRTVSYGWLIQAMGEALPRMVVLMDNTALGLFARYQEHLGERSWSVPALALMCIDVERSIADMPNTMGIAYEVPLVTSVVALRSLVHAPVRRVGVVHREMMTPLVERNRRYCDGEDIEIVARSVGDRSLSHRWAVLRNVRSLLRSADVDALWVLNDNVLLRPDIVSDIWVPLVHRYRKPVIVGAERLVDPSVGLGAIAVVPDHRALGAQGGQMVLTARDNEWQPPRRIVQPPLSVVKIVNARNLRRCAEVREEGLGAVDIVLE